MAVNMEELKTAIFDLVKSTYGKKNLKPMDVTKEMIAKFGDENCGKSDVKKALRELVDSGTLTYKYAGGSYVTLPEK
jgi:DNA replication protein DnaD